VQKFTLKDQVNQSIIYVHSGNHVDLQMKFGTKLAVRGIIIVLSGRLAGEVFESQMILASHLVSQLKDLQPGQCAVGRLIVSGNSIALDPMTAYDANLASAWAQVHPGEIEKLAAAGIASFADDDRNIRQSLINGEGQGQVQASPQFNPATQQQWVNQAQPGSPTLDSMRATQSEQPGF
jgi:hypothetical protein